MDSDLYKELYRFEWEQRSHLISAVNIPIVAITALATVLATIAMGYPYASSPNATIFVTCITISIVLLFVALILVLWSLLNVEYKKIPSPILLRQHHKKLTAWYLRHGKTIEDAENDFQDSFNDQLALAAEQNGKRNRLRGNCIFLASVFIGLSLLPSGVAGALYVSASIGAPDKTYNVHIVP